MRDGTGLPPPLLCGLTTQASLQSINPPTCAPAFASHLLYSSLLCSSLLPPHRSLLLSSALLRAEASRIRCGLQGSPMACTDSCTRVPYCHRHETVKSTSSSTQAAARLPAHGGPLPRRPDPPSSKGSKCILLVHVLRFGQMIPSLQLSDDRLSGDLSLSPRRRMAIVGGWRGPRDAQRRTGMPRSPIPSLRGPTEEGHVLGMPGH